MSLQLLVIEDNPGDVRLLTILLAEAGAGDWQIIHADRLESGLAHLEKPGADAVLLDLSLPDSQGLATFKRLHAAAPGVPVIVLSGLEDETMAVAAVQAGAQDYLVKGMADGQLLVRAVRYAIERYRMVLSQEFLDQVGTTLVASLDYETTLQQIARLAVPFLADYCLIDLITPAGDVARVAAAHADPNKASLVDRLRGYAPIASHPHPIFSVLEAGRLELTEPITDDQLRSIARDPDHLTLLQQLAPRSTLRLPLLSRPRPEGSQAGKRPVIAHTRLGAMTLAMAESGRRYDARDLPIAQEMARRCAMAIDNARLFQETQQARREAELLAAERTAILSQITDGVILRDTNGHLTFMNPAARQLVGYRDGDPVNSQERYQLLTSDGQPYPPEQRPLIRAAVAGETVIDDEHRIRRQDGSEIVVRASAAPVMTDDGTRLGGVLTMHDVTARYELERRKDEFFANISHDLRTPLTGILASLGVVLTHLSSDLSKPLQRLLVNAEGAAQRMTVLVDDLLDLSRLQAGRLQLHLDQCDATHIVRRAAAVIEPLVPSRQQHLTVTVPAEPVWITADAERLERVLVNLLSNAHKYGHDGGSIELSLTGLADEVIFAVADDGPGIPLAEQARIFERFSRLQGPTVSDVAGSGLGLAIARALTELHGGRVELSSQPGAGATFRVRLPNGQSIGGKGEDPDR